MKQQGAEADSGRTKAVRTRARKDLIIVGTAVLIGCVIVLLDPDRVFEWVATHKEVQIDELLTAVVIIGIGFVIFFWRRWTDLSQQVADYERFQDELSSINREAFLMSETDDLLQSCLSSDEAYRVIIRHLELQFPMMSGAIFAITQTRDTAEVVAKWGQPAVARNLFAIKDCWGLRRGRMNITRADDARVACAHVGPSVPVYAICVPMMAQGETLGVLYLDTGMDQEKATKKALTDAQERTVKTLAEHLALAVANLNLRETLRIQSIRDPLTGLFNRRYLEECLEREFRRALRTNSPLAILMIDLDHFKRFNDTSGHQAGDAVLRELAIVFQQQLRAEDIASRYGGDEFILVLPETDTTAASECAERLRRAIDAMPMQRDERSSDGDVVTLSIGLACYPHHGTTIEALLQAADAALYRAKATGRDRVVTAETG
jgi:diguanylate cyclase (GGDEF)-like protein